MREFIESLFIAAVSGIIAELTQHYVVAWEERLRERRKHRKTKSTRNKLRPH